MTAYQTTDPIPQGVAGVRTWRSPECPTISELMRTGPAQHVYSSARAVAVDTPAPTFTVRGRVALLALELWIVGPGGRLEIATVPPAAFGLSVEKLLRGQGEPAREVVLEGEGDTLWAWHQAATRAYLWCAYFWPLTPGAALEGVE